MTGAARIAAGLVAASALLGLALQLSASLDGAGTLAGAVWAMGRYFTVIANGLLLVVFAGIVARRPGAEAAVVVGGATLAIMLVGIVYALLLNGLFDLGSDRARHADMVLHRVTPILAPLFWLFFAPRGGLRTRDPWLWLLMPALYLAYALARGRIEGLYAYPFLDVGRLGWLRTALNAAAMRCGFLAAGFALVALDRRLGRRESGQAP